VVMAPQPLDHLSPGARVMRAVLSVVKIGHRIQKLLPSTGIRSPTFLSTYKLCFSSQYLMFSILFRKPFKNSLPLQSPLPDWLGLKQSSGFPVGIVVVMAHVELALIVNESKPDSVKPALPAQNITRDVIIFCEVRNSMKFKGEGDNAYLVPISYKRAIGRSNFHFLSSLYVYT